MTAEESLRLSAVWACVTVIAKSLASSHWDVFLEQPNGDRQPRRNTIAYRLLNDRPNPEMSAFGYREAALIQALIYGNFFAEIELTRGGLPAALWPIPPDRSNLERNEAGDLVVRVTGQGSPDVDLAYADVYHLRGPGLDGLLGFDIVSLAARSFAHNAAAERFGQSFYGNGTQMGGVLSSDANMTAEQMNEMRKQVNERHQGPDNAFKFMFLGGGTKYQALNATPNDAQFLETRFFLVEEVCRWFGVPPHKIAHLLRATNNNIEHQGIEFVRDALVPWAERMAQEANFKLIPVNFRGIRTRLDLDWLAEGDATSKARTDSVLVQNGLITRNEARKARGRNTVGPDGDKLTVQLNMTTLDKVGEKEAPAEQPPPQPDIDGAATALFFSAVKRGILRRYRKVKVAERRAQSVEDFNQIMRSDSETHARYVATLIEEVLETLNLTVDAFEILDVMEPALNEELRLVEDAYRRSSIEDWCDFDECASGIAAKLTELIEV